MPCISLPLLYRILTFPFLTLPHRIQYTYLAFPYFSLLYTYLTYLCSTLSYTCLSSLYFIVYLPRLSLHYFVVYLPCLSLPYFIVYLLCLTLLYRILTLDYLTPQYIRVTRMGLRDIISHITSRKGCIKLHYTAAPHFAVIAY